MGHATKVMMSGYIHRFLPSELLKHIKDMAPLYEGRWSRIHHVDNPPI